MAENTKATKTNLVYHFVCSDRACRRRTTDYIGLTTQKLRNRLGQHRYKGAIHEHFVDKHGDKPKIETLLNQTKIINRSTSKKQLYIAEAVAIEIRKPSLNVQKEFDYTLPSNRKTTIYIAPQPTRDTSEEHRDETREAGDEPQGVTATQGTTTEGATTNRCLRPLPHRRTQTQV